VNPTSSIHVIRASAGLLRAGGLPCSLPNRPHLCYNSPRDFSSSSAVYINVMKPNSLSESELVRKAGADLDAFSELVEHFRDSIISQCFSCVHDRHHASHLHRDLH